MRSSFMLFGLVSFITMDAVVGAEFQEIRLSKVRVQFNLNFPILIDIEKGGFNLFVCFTWLTAGTTFAVWSNFSKLGILKLLTPIARTLGPTSFSIAFIARCFKLPAFDLSAKPNTHLPHKFL